MKASTLLAMCLFAFGSIGHVSAATELKVGDPAPDFTLKASNGKTYKVSDFRNKQAIVLAWFPKAYTRDADFPLLSDPTKKTADAYGVMGAMGMANRWTFYIGKDGTIQSIDKDVKPATSAEDMVAKLHELGISTRGQ